MIQPPEKPNRKGPLRLVSRAYGAWSRQMRESSFSRWEYLVAVVPGVVLLIIAAVMRNGNGVAASIALTLVFVSAVFVIRFFNRRQRLR